MSNTIEMSKIDEILNDNDSHKITDMFEENVDCFIDDISDMEFAESNAERMDAIAHIYHDLAYMQLITAMTIKRYGLNQNILQVFIGKALDKELNKE